MTAVIRGSSPTTTARHPNHKPTKKQRLYVIKMSIHEAPEIKHRKTELTTMDGVAITEAFSERGHNCGE